MAAMTTPIHLPQSTPVHILTESNNTVELEYYTGVLAIVRLACIQITAPIICFFGITANIFNIIVLTRRNMASSTNVYLTGVAINDMTHLFFFYFYSLMSYKTIKSVKWYMECVPFIRCTANVCSNTTTWLIVTFTVERYIAVCHPMLRHKICTIKRAKMIVGIVVIVCFILTFPDYLLYHAIPIDPNSTVVYYTLSNTDLAETLSKFGYYYINQSFFIVLPFILLLIFNTILIRSVIHANKKRKKMIHESSNKAKGEKRHKAQSSEQRITVMLIVVVVAFLVLQFPSLCYMVYQSLSLSEIIIFSEVDTAKHAIFGNAVNILLLLAATLNFVLYSSLSSKFRDTFKQLCNCNSTKNGSTSGYRLAETTHQCEDISEDKSKRFKVKKNPNCDISDIQELKDGELVPLNNQAV